MKLHTQIFLAMGLGVAAGAILGEHVQYVRFLGDIFILLLKMIITPLILASIVTGVASIGDVSRLGKLGAKTVLYYGVTTWTAIIIGLILVNLLKPGVGVEIALSDVAEQAALADTMAKTPGEFFQEQIRTVIQNPFAALANMQVMAVIFFALLLGAVLTTLGEKGAVVTEFFAGFNEAMMKLTGWIMKLAPIGVFALIAGVVAAGGFGVLKSLGKYVVTVMLGLTIHCALLLTVFLRGMGRMSPREFLAGMRSALAIAFSTASSSSTLPVTMECVTDNLNVSTRTSSFVLPLGATVNMDGTALYESVAAIFIAQAYGIELGLGAQAIVFVTATLAAVGAAGIPSAGLVTMTIVLTAVGLPLEGAALIYGVDRVLDMCRTTVNVLGDSVGTVVIARSEGEDLAASAVEKETGR
jgi:Na+/H+-dicarboxylate symporter